MDFSWECPYCDDVLVAPGPITLTASAQQHVRNCHPNGTVPETVLRPLFPALGPGQVENTDDYIDGKHLTDFDLSFLHGMKISWNRPRSWPEWRPKNSLT